MYLCRRSGGWGSTTPAGRLVLPPVCLSGCQPLLKHSIGCRTQPGPQTDLSRGITLTEGKYYFHPDDSLPCTPPDLRWKPGCPAAFVLQRADVLLLPVCR